MISSACETALVTLLRIKFYKIDSRQSEWWCGKKKSQMAVGRNGYGVVTSGATLSGIEPAANVAIKIDWSTPGDQKNEGWWRSFLATFQVFHDQARTLPAVSRNWNWNRWLVMVRLLSGSLVTFRDCQDSNLWKLGQKPQFYLCALPIWMVNFAMTKSGNTNSTNRWVL